jgi:hypothetical protein
MSTPQEEPQDYILVCVEKPTVEEHSPATWLWLTVTSEIEQNPTRFAGFEKLCENEWLFPEGTHLEKARDFVAFCQRIGDGRMVCRAYKIHGKPEPLGWQAHSPTPPGIKP